jgi:hypothetical protein
MVDREILAYNKAVPPHFIEKSSYQRVRLRGRGP